MKSRLSTIGVEGLAADGQTIETTRPLEGLTTRDPSDPSIALLDGWATVADVLSFYQERNANEGYLRTATERRSVLELSRLVGYVPRPGVAASVYLAYTVDDRQVDPTVIATGAAVQSIPGPGETAQVFETGEDLEARRLWNNLQVRRTKPQHITLDNVLSLANLFIAGPTTTLKKGDPLLFVFGADGDPSVLRRVLEVGTATEDGKIDITLVPVPVAVVATVPSLAALVAGFLPLTELDDATRPAGEEANTILQKTYLGDYSDDPAGWAAAILRAPDVAIADHVLGEIKQFGVAVQAILDAITTRGPDSSTNPEQFVTQLLQPVVPQVANTLQLRRDLKSSFLTGADTSPQVLVNLAPVLKDSYYTAWSNAQVKTAPVALIGIYALRVSASLFGASVSKQPTYYGIDDPNHRAGELKPQSEWQEWALESDEDAKVLYLDQPSDAILPQSYALVQHVKSGEVDRHAFRVTRVDAVQRTAYGISGKSTRLTLTSDWWDPSTDDKQDPSKDGMAVLRSTLVLAQSEPLTLTETPIEGDVSGQAIELGDLYRELVSGRWVIFSGERADIPGVTGVHVSELLMISGLEHAYDPNLPGDKTHTTLHLATVTAYAYKRDTPHDLRQRRACHARRDAQRGPRQRRRGAEPAGVHAQAAAADIRLRTDVRGKRTVRCTSM